MKTKDTQSTILSISTFLIIISKRIYLGTEGGVFERGRMTGTQAVERHLLTKGGLRKLRPHLYNIIPKQVRHFSRTVKCRGQKQRLNTIQPLFNREDS